MLFTYQETIKVFEFYDKYRLSLTLDFVRCQGIDDISPATIYEWLGVRKKAKSSCGEISVSQSLTPKSPKPKTYRSSSYPSFHVQFIKFRTYALASQNLK